MTYTRYHEAVDYLQRRLWHQLPIRPVEEVLQDRIRFVLRQLGDPHLAFPVIHIGGSVGKGSTATITASILRAAGYRTGLYTSPHLQTFIERYEVDGRLIHPDRFADLVLGLDPLVQRMLASEGGLGRPSLVEIAFAVGMQHFADEKVDIAVVEVGLGGRTDCTNVFDDKPVTVITNIELEHTERLGRTRAAIAREKAALIRGHEMVVTGERHREALEVIEARCSETGAKLWPVHIDVKARKSEKLAACERFSVGTPSGRFDDLVQPLPGAHQIRNAAVAVTAVSFARREGLTIDERAVRQGLSVVRINGRFETVQQRPHIILDGAHNPAEARALAETLRRQIVRREAKVHLVCGILRDKDQPAMVRALAPVADSVVVTQPPLAERQGDPAQLVALFEEQLGPKSVTFEEDPGAALDAALARARPQDAVVVTGSMFLVGALRNRWVSEEEILSRRSAALQPLGSNL